jgi:two-component system sensor histidine kinase DegS
VAVQHTVVPFLWRRHLGIARAALAVAALLLYLLLPIQRGLLIAVVIGFYLFYSIFILVRDTIETSLYPASMLLLDMLFFFVCTLHPSQEGYWLSTIAYFYLLALGTLLYNWRQVSLVVGACVAFFLLVRPGPTYVLWPAILVGGMLSILLAIQKKNVQERLSSALKRSVISRSDAEMARQQERERIAADFHDGPLQSFISFQMRLEIIRKLMGRDHDAAMRELVQLQELGRAQVTELRSFVRNMQPADVNRSNLPAAVREAVEHFERDSGIAVNLVCGELMNADDAVANELLQIIREALNNIRKHSKASQVSISLEQAADGIELSVHDDGSGFPFSGSFSLDELELLRLGPRSIKRRVRTLGGDLTLESKPSEGATLKIRINR